MSDSKKHIRAVDEIIRKARTAGTSIKGQISLDARVAREKMKTFRLEDPWSFGVEFFVAATQKGASRVEMHIAPGKFKMQFDGRPFTTTDLENMYSDLFIGENADADKRAGGRLALALNAISAANPEWVEVVSGGGTSGARLVVQPGMEDTVEAVTDVPDGTQITARHGVPDGQLLDSVDGAKRAIELLSTRCRYADVALIVNGERLSHGVLPVESEVSISMEEDSTSGMASFVPTCVNGEACILVNGVLVETEPLPGDYAGVRVIVKDPAFQTDLGGNKIVKDEAYLRARRVAARAADQVLGRLHRRKTEVYLFEGRLHASPLERLSFKCASFENDVEKPLLPGMDFLSPSFYLSARALKAEALLHRTGRLFRPVVKAVYFSWLLLIPKLVGRVFSTALGDWATLAFLLLIVVFFSMLAFLIVLHAIAGPRAKRKPVLQLHLDRFGVEEAARLCGFDDRSIRTVSDIRDVFSEDTALRVEGTVASEGDDPTRDRTVLTDLWMGSKHSALRLLSSRPFSLRLDAHEDAMVTVDLSDGVWVVGPYHAGGGRPVVTPLTRRKADKWIEHHSADLNAEEIRAGRYDNAFGGIDGIMKNGTGISVAEGDRVAIFAPPGAWTRSGDGNPGLILSGEGKNPLILHVISTAQTLEATP